MMTRKAGFAQMILVGRFGLSIALERFFAIVIGLPVRRNNSLRLTKIPIYAKVTKKVAFD